MFQVIEHARMMVGTKAISTLSTGYLNALEFAKTRVQSADLTRQGDKSAPRVAIIRHPDVRHTLMANKAYAEGLRALVYYTAAVQDRILVGQRAGADTTLDEAVNDLLLPIVKGAGSERSYEQLGHALQVFGGSGYLQDYPLEQYIRDAKIDTLYEGTTAIQSMDLLFRKIVRDNGKALTTLLTQVHELATSDAGNGQLKNERELLRKGLEDVQGMLGAVVGFLTSSQEDPRNIYKVGLNSVRLLLSLGDVVIAWLLLRQAKVALDALTAGATGRDKAFYEGKVAAARFFAQTRLPLLAGERAVVEATDLELMNLDEAAF
jgi:hypothetical protein